MSAIYRTTKKSSSFPIDLLNVTEDDVLQETLLQAITASGNEPSNGKVTLDGRLVSLIDNTISVEALNLLADSVRAT